MAEPKKPTPSTHPLAGVSGTVPDPGLGRAPTPPIGTATGPGTRTGDEDEADPRDLAIAALTDQVGRLTSLVMSGTVNVGKVSAEQEAEARYEAAKKEIEKGNVVRSQEAADRMFPGGSKLFRCLLTDGNRHPQLTIRADTEIDAAARYMHVCGVTAAEKKTVVEPLGAVSRA